MPNIGYTAEVLALILADKGPATTAKQNISIAEIGTG